MASTNELKNFHDEVIEFMKTGGGGASYALPTASATQKGGVMIGAGLSMVGDTLNCTVSEGTLAEATTVSSGLMSAADKVKLNGLENYTLPNATTSTLGGVKIGDGISVSGGTISLKTASATQKGGVKIVKGSGLEMRGDTLYISSGVILSSVPSNIEGEMWYEI